MACLVRPCKFTLIHPNKHLKKLALDNSAMQDANKKTGEIYILRYVCFSVELKTRQTRNDSYFAMYETLKSI